MMSLHSSHSYLSFFANLHNEFWRMNEEALSGFLMKAPFLSYLIYPQSNILISLFVRVKCLLQLWFNYDTEL